VSAYRERPLKCPRCAIELAREETRDVWRCKRCAGALITVEEVISELVKFAPALVPPDGARGITTIGRHGQPLTCPTCSAPMEPVFLGGIEIDRCYHDQQLWLDAGELAKIIDRARAQVSVERRGWFAELVHGLFG
jgi:Zn-finger nucleic acid-binding protein